jgi:hypothetical protein
MNTIATTVEQAKELLDLGIDPNTASMSYDRYEFKGKSGYTLACTSTNSPFSHKDAIPAWTLVDLIKLLPCEVIEGGRHYYLDISKFSVRYGVERAFHISDFYLDIAEFKGEKTLLDLVVEAITILKERGKI